MTEEDASNKKSTKRQDIIAWFVSLIFILALLGAMWGWGVSKGWNAPSAYRYEEVNNTQIRFLPKPFACNDTTIRGRSGEGCSWTWYFWKLPPDAVSALSRATAWVLYCLHQVFVWGLIYRAQLVNSLKAKRNTTQKYSSNLQWFNWSLLGVNSLFHVLHLLQTHWTYDATAQDVSMASSQGSVILMMCFILLMEYRDRGIILMWPNPRSDDRVAKYLRLSPGPIQLVRRYHGFVFSWASIYTFWYHPMENTWGHTLGFFHTAIVLLQGSLIYTDMHLNKYWRLLNETWVLIHGTVVALQTQLSSAWTIFAFGFGFILAFTQVFSLPFWKKVSPYFRIIPVVVYFTIVLALCGTVVEGRAENQSGFSRMYDMVFIPAVEYAIFLISWVLIYIFIKIEAAIIGKRNPDEDPEISATKQSLYLCGIVLIYAFFMIGAHLARYAQGSLTLLMIVFECVFSAGVCITVVFFKQIMGPFRKLTRS